MSLLILSIGEVDAAPWLRLDLLLHLPCVCVGRRRRPVWLSAAPFLLRRRRDLRRCRNCLLCLLLSRQPVSHRMLMDR